MDVIFLSLCYYESINDADIYTDLLDEFRKNGHAITMVCPVERRRKIATHLKQFEDYCILYVKTGNIQKTNFIEKGISTFTIEYKIKKAIKKFLKGKKYDLILYCTPPITLVKPIKYLKKRNAVSYLMLKDIFPQNAIDIGVLKKTGLLGIFYRLYRKKEVELYKISDYIGCMSPKNTEYLLNNNSMIMKDKVKMSPNSIRIRDYAVDSKESIEMKKKYGLPLDKKILVYGGNIGKPQGVDFIIQCLKEVEKYNDIYMLIVGDGTEFNKLEKNVNECNYKNVKLLKRLAKSDYDKMIASCDVGLIFLDYRFTIPNFPSRILSYMQVSLPIISCTDRNTDIGNIIQANGFGWKCYSDSVDSFVECIDQISKMEREQIIQMGKRSYTYLYDNYRVETQYRNIIKDIKW